MRKYASFLLLVLAGACTQSAPVYNGRGERMETVACLDHQTLGGMTSCLQRAEKLCPGGYYWIGSTNHPIPNQITEPAAGLMPTNTRHSDISSVRAYNNGQLAGFQGGYGWAPRITANRGDYQYITIQCK